MALREKVEMQFFKLTSLPATLEPDAWYVIKNGSYVEVYVTDENSVPIASTNLNIINDQIDSRLAGYSTIKVVANITARNAHAAANMKDQLYYVVDATDDPTVASGSAIYAYEYEVDTHYKVQEANNLELEWASILNGPTSSPAAIDGAVAKAHEHNNLSLLQRVTESPKNNLALDGKAVQRWTEATF